MKTQSQSDWKHYIQAAQRRLPLVLLVSFGLALIAYFIVQSAPTTYQVHYSYLVSLSERESVDEYRFDGFYALQATDLFTATVARWATTVDVVVAAHERAGLPIEDSDPRQLVSAVRSEKTAPQLVEVVVSGKTRQEAERLAQGLREVMDEHVEAYHDQGIPAVTFRVVATDPWTGSVEISSLIVVVGVFVLSFFLLINGVLLLESFKQE